MNDRISTATRLLSSLKSIFFWFGLVTFRGSPIVGSTRVEFIINQTEHQVKTNLRHFVRILLGLDLHMTQTEMPLFLHNHMTRGC